LDTTTALWFGLGGVVLPFTSALLCALAAWWGFCASEEETKVGERLVRATAMLVPGVIVSLYFAQWITQGKLSLPPREFAHTIPLLMLFGLVAGVVAAVIPVLRPEHPRQRLVIFAALIIAALASSLLKLPPPYTWIPRCLPWWILAWASLRYLTSCNFPAVSMIPLGLWSAGVAAVLLATGNLKFAQLSGAAAFAVLGLFIAAMLRGRSFRLPKPSTGVSLADPVIAVFSAYVTGLLTLGVTAGQTPRPLLLAIGGVTPLAAAIITELVFKHAKPTEITLHGTTTYTVPRYWLACGLASAAVVTLCVGGAIWGDSQTASTGYP